MTPLLSLLAPLASVYLVCACLVFIGLAVRPPRLFGTVVLITGSCFLVGVGILCAAIIATGIEGS